MNSALRPPGQLTARWVHPLAWWAWGLSAATLAILSNEPIIHFSIMTSVFIVLLQKRSSGSWANVVVLFIRLAVFIIAFRIFIELLFGVHFGGSVLITLPEFELPNWLGSISIGGTVGTNGLIAAFVNGFKLATIVVAAAAPATLVPPNLLLKSLPSALYEAGLVTVIALGFLPALSADAKRIKTAAALRGKPAVGVRSNLKLLLPLIDSALDRAVTLANAMETKGFGRSKPASTNPALIGLGLVGGLLLLIISLLNLLRNPADQTNLVILGISLLAISISVVLSGKSKLRTIYRELEFSVPEFTILVSAVLVIGIGIVNPTNTALVAGLTILLIVLPIWSTPKVPAGFQR